MRKAFTLIELVVAIALLAMVFFFASMIFKVSVNAQRTSSANAKIMQKLRAITDQLNTDFEGLRLDSPLALKFDLSADVRSDCIAFFANGDFQSTGQHGPPGSEETVVGNVASIFYGLAKTPTSKPQEKILVRRQTILIAEPPSPNPDFDDEYYDKSLSEWRVDPPASFSEPYWPEWVERPELDPERDADFDKLSVMHMAKGVDNFAVQYVGWDYDHPHEFEFNQWRPKNEDIKGNESEWENRMFSPRAFKFTFTLYDSKGIIKKGRTFTHIVYLGD